ncbi:MAG: helicase-related protein, partial [Nitrosotalea sp.]
RDRWQEEEQLELLTSAETLAELEFEINVLKELVEMAEKAEESEETETKLKKLKEEILPTLKNEKLLIFTESKDTLHYLVERIKHWGYSVTHIDGSMSHEERQKAEDEFKKHAQIMVSTEAGGEGINLQFCHLMINYDIPWNPNRLEQRMGRIHRYGQEYPVSVYNMIAKNTIEGEIFEVLFRKLENMKKALGNDRVFDVLGEVLPSQKIRELIVEALTKGRRSGAEIAIGIDALKIDEQIRKRLDLALKDASILPPINLDAMRKQVIESDENKLEPEYAEYFFLRACEDMGYKGIKETQSGLLTVPIEIYKILKPSSSGLIAFSSPIKVTFDKKIAEEFGATFLAPSSTQIQTLAGKLLEKYVTEMRKGALFSDQTQKLDGFIWFLESQINYGDKKIAEKRMISVYQPRNEKDSPSEITPMILWELEPLSNASTVHLD